LSKIAIVTGANSGMGLATTVELARQGMHVVMACRSKERGEKALQEAKAKSGSAAIELMSLDLGSLSSIRAFAQAFRERFASLDVLVNNAGVVSLKRDTTSDGFESMLGINHLGHFLLTNLLLDLLKRAPEGRIVNVASGAYKWGRIHFDDPHLTKGFNVAKGYGQSKLANILFTRELARRLAGTRATVNCLHPGGVATSIGVDRKTGFGKTVMKLARLVLLTPEQGAETTLYLATSPDVFGVSGEYYYRKKRVELPAKVTDSALAAKFWTWSEQEVGL
jgi:NAD(P)-dependent dehydrogenase (short-subunit alcohol dehydrogenase family)